MLDFQTEHNYQKQLTIFQNKKWVLLGKTGKQKPRTLVKTPKEIIEGTCIDKKCPFLGNFSTQGQIRSGMVTRRKIMVIYWVYLHYINKYNHFEKCHENMPMHRSPSSRDTEIRNIVTVGRELTPEQDGGFNLLKVSNPLVPRSNSRNPKTAHFPK